MPVDACFEIDFGDVDVLVLSDEDEINGAIVEHGADGRGACGVFQDGGGTTEIDPTDVEACEIIIRRRADELGIECRPSIPL